MGFLFGALRITDLFIAWSIQLKNKNFSPLKYRKSTSIQLIQMSSILNYTEQLYENRMKMKKPPTYIILCKWLIFNCSETGT